MANDMVVFRMPDGTEVSNDPRFDMEKAREEVLASTPNRGDIGIPRDEQDAQTQVLKTASLNSGQPGVGENAAPDDAVKDAYGPLGSPAQQVQKEDMKQAREEGGDPNNTTVDDAEPVDSNEKVLEVRKARQEAEEKAAKALADLGEDGPGDAEKPYSEWSGKQLKAEALRRNAERNEKNQLEFKGIRKSAELAKLLEEDDSRQSTAGNGTDGGSSDTES